MLDAKLSIKFTDFVRGNFLVESSPLILHVFDGFRVGGTEKRTCNIINYLQWRFRHIIVSNNGNFDAAKHIQSSIEIHYLHPKSIRNKFYPLNILEICRIIRDVRPDLMIACEWGAIDWVLANSLYRQCPVIMTVEGFEVSELFSQKKHRLFLRRILYRKCNRVVVCSRVLFRIALRSWKLKAPQLLHIPNGIDCRKFKPAPEKKSLSDETKLGIIASLIKLKNHRKLLKCIAELPQNMQISLYIAGDGPEFENLRKQCHDSGLDDCVHFLGHVDDTAFFLKGMDIFCLASDTEQMPMVVLEAMATELPIVSTDVGDVKEMLAEENRSFIVNKENDSLYTKALKKLIEDKSLRKSIGKANRQRCLSLYDGKLMFKRYEELYTSCIAIGN